MQMMASSNPLQPDIPTPTRFSQQQQQQQPVGPFSLHQQQQLPTPTSTFMMQPPLTQNQFQQQQTMGMQGGLFNGNNNNNNGNGSPMYMMGGVAGGPQDPSAGCCTSCCADPRERCCGGPSKPPAPGQMPGCLDGCCPPAPGHVYADKDLPSTCCDKSFAGVVLLMLLGAVGVILCCVLPGDGDQVYSAVSLLKGSSVTNAHEASLAMCNGARTSTSYDPSKLLVLFTPSFTPRQCSNSTQSTVCTPIKGIGYFAEPTLQTCAEDIFSVTFIQSQIQYFRDFAILVFFALFVLSFCGVVWACYYNNNAWAVAELVKYGRIVPPMANQPGCCGGGNPQLLQQQQQMQMQQQPRMLMLPNGQMVPDSSANPNADFCCCNCGPTTGPTTGSGAGCCGDAPPTGVYIGGLPRKDYSQTFPILLHGTPQFNFFMSLWRATGLTVAVLSLVILYPLLTITPTWKKYSAGELKDFFVATELKFVVAIFVGVGLTVLPILWVFVFKPLLWVLGVIPWMVYRICLDPRVVQRPEGFRTPEEIARSDMEQLAKILFTTSDDANISNNNIHVAQSPATALFSNGGGNSGQSGVGQNNFSIPADAAVNPSTYTLYPPRVFNAMGSERLARPHAVQAHQVAFAQLLAGQNDGGVVNSSAALTAATNALSNGGGGTNAASGLFGQSTLNAGSAFGSGFGGASNPANSTPVKAGKHTGKNNTNDTEMSEEAKRSDFIANSSRFNQSTLYKDINGRDPLAVYDDLSCCQQLDVFFIEDCSLCGSMQRSQQTQMLSQIRLQQEIAAQFEEIRRLKELSAQAEITASKSKRDKKSKSKDKKDKDSGRSKDKESRSKDKRSRRASLEEGGDDSETSSRKEEQKKDKEKKSKHRSDSKSKKEKSDKKKDKKHRHSSRSKGRDEDEDDDKISVATAPTSGAPPPGVTSSQNLWSYQQKPPGMMSGSTVFMASAGDAAPSQGGTDVIVNGQQNGENEEDDGTDPNKTEKKSKKEKKEKSHHKSRDKSASRDKKNKNRDKEEKSEKKREKSHKKEKRSKSAEVKEEGNGGTSITDDGAIVSEGTAPTFTPRD